MLNAIAVDNRCGAFLSVLMKCFMEERDYYIFIKELSADEKIDIALSLRRRDLILYSGGGTRKENN